LLAVILVIVCPLLLGAADAPSPHTEGFYINDSSSLLTEENRQDITRIADDLYVQTGSRLVYFAAATLDGLEPGEYANRIITDWELTDSDVLLLDYYDPEQGRSNTMVGENLDGVWEGTVQPLRSDDRMAPYLALARRLYTDRGITPAPKIQPLLAEEKDGIGGLGTGTIIFIAVMCVVLARGLRMNRKYKQKFLKGYIRPRRRYTRTHNEEDEYNNEKIYKITYDDQD
jgi:hypothetical protein